MMFINSCLMGRVVSGTRDHIKLALGPLYMVSGTRDYPPPETTLASVYT